MAFMFVERMDEVLQHALLDREGARARPPRRRVDDTAGAGDGQTADAAPRDTPSSGEPMAADAP